MQAKHYLSVEELVQEEEKKKSKKKKKGKRTQLTTFTPITTGRFQWLGTGDPGGVVQLRRDSSLAAIFLTLAPEAVVQVMVDQYYTLLKKGEHAVQAKEIYEYWAVRIFMHGKRLPKLLDNWSGEYQMEGVLPMGKSRYKRLQRVWICPEAVMVLNKASESLIVLPEVLNIDEKLKPFSGITPYLRHVPGKDPSNGHWICETTIKAPSTQLPFLLNCYPVQQTKGPTMLEFFQSAVGNLDTEMVKKVVIIADAYYIDAASRDWLRDSNFKYLLSVNPKRFAEVWAALSSKVVSSGDWAIAWSDETEEAALLHYHPTLGKIHLITNAFIYFDDDQAIKEPPFEPYYKQTFNTTDHLNQHLHGKQYPYSRPGWQYNFDDHHFTALLWNSYVLYHECHPEVQQMEWRDYCLQLSQELQQATNL